jgi:hypothetical protein
LNEPVATGGTNTLKPIPIFPGKTNNIQFPEMPVDTLKIFIHLMKKPSFNVPFEKPTFIQILENPLPNALKKP